MKIWSRSSRNFHVSSLSVYESQVENFISNATALAARSSSSASSSSASSSAAGALASPSADASNYSSLGTFDFVSVCPPYKKVDYVDMLDNLSKSPLISGSSYVMIEFPSEVWWRNIIIIIIIIIFAHI